MKIQYKQWLSSPFLIGFLLFLALLPTLFSLFHLVQARSDIELVKGRLSALKAHVAFVQRSKHQEIERIEKLKKADPAYLEKEIESVVLLESEIKRLQAIPSDRAAERLRFLKEGRNSLRLIESNFRKRPPFQESDVKLERSIEVDAEDLKHLLSKIEMAPAPELAIKKFELTRKASSPQEEVYQINFELIKREFLHE